MGRHTLNRGRALRYVRRHAMEFHGSGVVEAVRVLPRLNFGDAAESIRRGLADVAVLLGAQGPLRLAFDDAPPVAETAHGLTVVGYKDQVTTGTYFCPDDRLPGTTPVTAADVTNVTECVRCGTRLLGPAVTPAECDECGHAHVSGVPCVEDTFCSFMCGCQE